EKWWQAAADDWSDSATMTVAKAVALTRVGIFIIAKDCCFRELKGAGLSGLRYPPAPSTHAFVRVRRGSSGDGPSRQYRIMLASKTLPTPRRPSPFLHSPPPCAISLPRP